MENLIVSSRERYLRLLFAWFRRWVTHVRFTTLSFLGVYVFRIEAVTRERRFPHAPSFTTFSDGAADSVPLNVVPLARRCPKEHW